MDPKPIEVKNEIVSFYEQLFKEYHLFGSLLDGLDFESISLNDSEILESFQEEILGLINGMIEDKVLGPNGFTISFSKGVRILLGQIL